jgi:hypothetical protein
MVRLPKSFLGLMLALSLIAVGCRTAEQATISDDASTPGQAAEVEASSPASEEAKSPDSQASDDQKPVAAQPSGATAEDDKNTVPVTIYVMDDQCNEFVKKTVQVSADNILSDAVGKVITDHEYDHFKLAGYRVQVDQAQGMATVDLRLAPDSERQFVSLSSCEQRILFGGIEATLLQNPDWQINTVTFTDRGEEIVL